MPDDSLASPSPDPGREDFRTALANLIRAYALDVTAERPAEEIARLMDEARVRAEDETDPWRRDAAAAEALLTPLAKRHAMIPTDWGGGVCGTCWIKGNSRAAWPCEELLAIAALLPASPTPSAPSGAGEKE